MEAERAVFPVEDALEMVLLFDRRGTVIKANGTARRELNYERLEGQPIHSLFPNSFRETGGGFGTQIPLGDQVQRLVIYRGNRTCFPVEAKIRENGDPPGSYLCMAVSILEREHLEREVAKVREEAGQAAKAKAEFVANVTHELRTPVNGILGNIRELSGEVTDPGILKTLRLVERCCGDMNKIIDNILDFSKLDAGKFVLEPRRFHFRNMLDYVKAQHMARITEKGLDFFLTVSPGVPEYVVGDELRIVQILNNLLSNALKFTSVGKITLQVFRTAQSGDKAELFFIVSDTGIGIREEDREKLFRSFTQADASISRKYGGTGLGLSICRQLVELMDGRIDAEGREGEGSSFSFSIWVGASQEEQEAAPTDDVRAAFLGMAAGEKEASGEDGELRSYGSLANREALKKNLSRLILSVEMENWEKAEMFMETVRQLFQAAPPEVKRQALRLKMAIQKEDYDKVTAEYHKLEVLAWDGETGQ